MNSKLHTVFRGQPELISSSARRFGGKDYYARFSSSKPLIMEMVAFYGRKLTDDEYIQKYIPGQSNKYEGPAPPKWALLILGISQCRLFYPKLKEKDRQVFMEKMMVEVNVSKFTEGHVFFVKLPEAVIIPANIVFDVTFQLYGIDEELKFYSLGASDNRPELIHVEGCNATIQVHPSSSQCAGFRFRLDESVANPPVLPLKMAAVKPQMPVMNASVSPLLMKKGVKKGKAMKYLANCISFLDNLNIC